ncbi:MAG: hypothetical protein HY790_01910 [Deltaproteobacteria bacterium]|nr:hypothetical protein [Deltaproteobacteria bacterium]
MFPEIRSQQGQSRGPVSQQLQGLGLALKGPGGPAILVPNPAEDLQGRLGLTGLQGPLRAPVARPSWSQTRRKTSRAAWG